MDRVIYNMATFPPREKALKGCVERILPQCDELNIYLNQYTHENIPEYLYHEKINIYLGDQNAGDIGDVGKFFCASDWKGYVFTVDDKLIYPENYTKRMIEAIETYGRKAVVSAHGRIFPEGRLKTYYYDERVKFFGCLRAQWRDMFVHELGTGAMAFHTDTCRPGLSIFKTTNMTDIWMSIWLQQNEIPILNPSRPNRWIGISKLHDDGYSIHNYCNKSDQLQTDTVNGVKWKLRTIDGKETVASVKDDDDPYSTHLELLNFVFEHFKIKNVVEFGCGHFSTLFFLEKGVKLMSIEMQEKKWYDEINAYYGKYSGFQLVFSPGAHGFKKLKIDNCDLCLVDGHLNSRPDTANFMFNKADIIICHDYEHPVYKWERINKPANYRLMVYHYKNVKQAMFINEKLLS